MADTAPMTPPVAAIPTAPGKPRCGAGLAPNAICAATVSTNSAKILLNTALGKASATAAPSQAPITMPGVRRQTTGHSTAPRRWWARTDEMEVTTMVASDVPMARCMTMASSIRWPWKIQASTGTMIKPPPTPSSPAMTPANAPSVRYNNRVDTRNSKAGLSLLAILAGRARRESMVNFTIEQPPREAVIVRGSAGHVPTPITMIPWHRCTAGDTRTARSRHKHEQ